MASRALTTWIAALALVAVTCAKKEDREGSTGAAARDVPEVPALKEPHATVRESSPHPSESKTRFDIVYVMDTTGSMEELIDAARNRISEVAAFIQSGEPSPSVRFGLVAYRDRGDYYTTMLFDLDPDVPDMKMRLSQLAAAGGGDNEEDVVAGLDRAIREISWDSEAALKMIILVGDAPPHLDYADPSLDSVLAMASKEGIRINTIPFGPMGPKVTETFQRIAEKTGGVYEGISAEAMLESAIRGSIRKLARGTGVSYVEPAP